MISNISIYIIVFLIFFVLPNITNLTEKSKLHTFYITNCIIGLIIFIYFTNIPYKNIIILIMIFIYYKNIKLFFYIFNSCYIQKSLQNFNLSDYIRIYGLNKNKLHHKPNIILFNYVNDRIENFIPSLFDIPFSIMITSYTCSTLRVNTFCDVITTDENNSFDKVKSSIKQKINDGKYVFCYINEAPYINRHNFGKYRSGMFVIARDLNIPITLIAFDNIHTTWYGGIKEQPFFMNIGPTFYVKKNKGIEYYKYMCKKFFRKNSKKFERIKKFLDF